MGIRPITALTGSQHGAVPASEKISQQDDHRAHRGVRMTQEPDGGPAGALRKRDSHGWATYYHGADLQTHSGECLLYAAPVRQRHGDFFRGVRTPSCKVPLQPGLYSPPPPREVFPSHRTSNDSHRLQCLHRAHFPLVSDFSQEHVPRMNLAHALLIYILLSVSSTSMAVL